MKTKLKNVCMYEYICMYAWVSSQDHNQNLLHKASDIYISELKFSVSYYNRLLIFFPRHTYCNFSRIRLPNKMALDNVETSITYFISYVLTVCIRYNFLLFVQKISQSPFKVSRLWRPSPSIKKVLIILEITVVCRLIRHLFRTQHLS